MEMRRKSFPGTGNGQYRDTETGDGELCVRNSKRASVGRWEGSWKGLICKKTGKIGRVQVVKNILGTVFGI